ncbi:ABC-2 transporter permease [Bacillus luteolus]|uniref:ABC-2 transporter permease n=1 Tax=Litchfieldia luteola TaxID=682179 RepID=A0ABR9QL54_9BACI|nr:ABC-2 transporter permease [Cytobacillus luteolus]MBE4909232.1 ABC-2 transporter permease [Cytobacillus luteolus]MBP1940311.1 ABC-2 type transport system permease protein [Cytobacillus luteolus]
MIIPFIKKDLVVLLRNPQELMVLLLMPLLLITILGFALGGVMGKDAPPISAKVAFIDHSDETKDIEAFMEKVKAKSLPVEAVESLSQGADQLKPIQILVNEVFGNKELKEIVQLEKINQDQIDAVLNDESYAAVIEIPENFTLDILSSVLLEEPASTSITLYKNEGKVISTNIVEDVLLHFQKQLSTMTVIGKAGILLEAVDSKAFGAVETVSKRDPINSVQYYTVGMSVMFIMFIASNSSSFAYREKQLHVFNRIILSNTSRWSYLTGVFFSVMLIAFIQQIILYGVTSLVFDVVWEDILGFIVVNLSLCFAIGGLATLLTSLNFRINSEAVSSFFGNVMVAIFAFLGGSFTPIGDSSSVIGFLGNLTPNGAGMSSLLQLLQGAELSSIYNHILFLLVFGLIMMTVAVVSFPKRGDAI